jgi:N4-gp56 family major capsid protein
MAFTLNMTAAAQLDDSVIALYDQQFIVAAAEEGVMEQFVDYKKVIGGESIKFQKFAQLSLATTALDEDDDVTSEAMSDTEVLFTPVEYGKVVTTTKLIELQSGGKAGLAASRLVGMNMGRTQDKLAILALEAGSNSLVVDGGLESALTATDVMTVSFLNKLYNKLGKANINNHPAAGMYVAILHDDVIHDLRDSAGSGSWVDINKYARPEQVLKNEVGMLAGFRIIRDNHITINTDAGDAAVDTYKSLCFGFNALGKAVSFDPKMVINGPFDKLARFANVGWYGAFKYGIVDTDALWYGITASSVGSN